jgi:hypothetical protein
MPKAKAADRSLRTGPSGPSGPAGAGGYARMIETSTTVTFANTAGTMTAATGARVAKGQVCITGITGTPANVVVSPATLSAGGKSPNPFAGLSSQVTPSFTCTGTNAVFVEWDDDAGAVQDGWTVYLLLN